MCGSLTHYWHISHSEQAKATAQEAANIQHTKSNACEKSFREKSNNKSKTLNLSES